MIKLAEVGAGAHSLPNISLKEKSRRMLEGHVVICTEAHFLEEFGSESEM